jgi:hypothetical protein
MANIGPGNFSNWGATPGIQTLGPPVAVNVPNLCDSTNTTATVAALYVVSTSGGLQVPPEAGGVIQSGDVPNPGQQLQWSGASLETTGAPAGPFPGNSGPVVNWNQTHSETSTQSMLADVLEVQQPNPTAQLVQNAVISITNLPPSALQAFKWE